MKESAKVSNVNTRIFGWIARICKHIAAASQKNDGIRETTAGLQGSVFGLIHLLSIKLKVENVKIGTKLLSQFRPVFPDNDIGCLMFQCNNTQLSQLLTLRFTI